MNYINSRRPISFLFLSVLSIVSLSAHAALIEFNQINWFDSVNGTSTLKSGWGLMEYEFTGFSDLRFLNLNVNGNWVVQNMGIASLYGTGESQKIRTFFDLGVSHGTEVTTLDYIVTVSDNPISSVPTGTFTDAPVTEIDYELGCEGSFDMGTSGQPETTSGIHKKPNQSAKLPNIGKFVNQKQKSGECAPGAISNSLKYLRATKGNPPKGVKIEIGDIQNIIGKLPNGRSPSSWPEKEKAHFDALPGSGILNKILDGTTQAVIDEVVKAVMAGKDVKLDLAGHVAVVGGIRDYGNGLVEFDIFDDNQKDDKGGDPIRKVTLKDGKVIGVGSSAFDVDGFVIEYVPEPPVVALFAFGLVLVSFQGTRYRIKGRSKTFLPR